MFEIRVRLSNGQAERGYASSFTEACKKVISFYRDAPAVTFLEIPMTAMRQGRDTLGCFARKQAMKGVK